MSGEASAEPRGVTGRADLLRLLAIQTRNTLTLDTDSSGWFGYVRQRDELRDMTSRLEGVLPPSTGIAAPEMRERKEPLRLPFIHAVICREERRPPVEADTPTDALQAEPEPLDPDSAKPRSPTRLVGFDDLVPQARLMPALRRQLGTRRAGSLDIERLVRDLAARRFSRRLPRRAFMGWHADLVVLLDFAPRLWPYREDMHRLAERLLRQVGHTGVSLRIINHGPSGPWSDWLQHQNPRLRDEPSRHDWTLPPAGTPVLIVGDLGLLLGPGSATAHTWARFIKDLVRAGVRPVALVPLGAGQLGDPIPPALPVLRWSPDAPVRPMRVRGAAVTHPDGLDDLLAMVAATRRVDPPLLRAMRRINPKAPLNAGLEGALWCHGDVEAFTTAAIRAPAARERHLRRFTECLADLHAELDRQRRYHHAHLRAALNHEETLLWAAHAGAAADDHGAKQRIAVARRFIRRLAETVTRPGSELSSTWRSVAGGILQRADDVMAARFADEMHRLFAVVQPAAPPGWIDPAVIARIKGADQSAIPVWLVHDIASGELIVQAEPSGTRQRPFGEAFHLDAGGARATGIGPGGLSTCWISSEALPAHLGRLGETAGVRITTSGISLAIAPVRRPLGAFGWGCDRNGLFVRSAPLGPWQMSWGGPSLRAIPSPEGEQAPWALEADAARHPDAKGALRFGIEWRFGVYAELTITTKHGSANQRLRWIEPGTFLMGSPETEAGRTNNEGPRHEVTISKGFWLFDTACTQALWQAVMGNNQSDFKGLDRPVEQVSWDDVRGFLERINALVPGLELMLPTEAQWEYACRAGTRTPFSFGETITPEQVNYDGNLPYRGGKKGLSRRETVPVASLPANPWGLYEMHGNIWEWCADGQRSYTADAVTDPVGPTDPGVERVLRCGSWRSHAQVARSACRYAGLPGLRFNNYGFRCARVQES